MIKEVKILSHEEIQAKVYELALEVVRICRKHDINYVVTGGTILGAIRHQDFIPWDDDLDFGMLAPEYDRFIKVCQTELNPKKYFLQTGQTDVNYAFDFAKLRLKQTKIEEAFSSQANQKEEGIFVDIFPFRSLPDQCLKRLVFKYRVKYLNNLIWVKLGYGSPRQRGQVRYWLLNGLAQCTRLKWLKYRRQSLIRKNCQQVTKQVAALDYLDEVLTREMFLHRVYLPFRKTKFWSFKDYHAYLKQAYGKDYLRIPPQEEQACHANIAYEYLESKEEKDASIGRFIRI